MRSLYYHYLTTHNKNIVNCSSLYTVSIESAKSRSKMNLLCWSVTWGGINCSLIFQHYRQTDLPRLQTIVNQHASGQLHPRPKLYSHNVQISPASSHQPADTPISLNIEMSDEERQHALASFKTKLLESREWEAKLKALRIEIKGLQKDFDHTEDNIKALQSVGQIIGEVLKQLDDERCK